MSFSGKQGLVGGEGFQVMIMVSLSLQDTWVGQKGRILFGLIREVIR